MRQGVAIVVAVKDYGGNFSALKHCERDAEGLCKNLEQLGFEVIVLSDSRAKKTGNKSLVPTYTNIMAQLDGLKLDKNQKVVLAFSGHGVQREVVDEKGKVLGDESHLVPKDGAVKNPATLISLNQAMKCLKKSGAGDQLILSDACRNDVEGLAPAVGGKNDLSKNAHTDSTIILGTRSGSKAWESAQLEAGVFSHFLGKALEEEKKKKGDTTAADVYKSVEPKVNEFVEKVIGKGAEQKPEMLGTGKFVIIDAKRKEQIRQDEALAAIVQKYFHSPLEDVVRSVIPAPTSAPEEKKPE